MKLFARLITIWLILATSMGAERFLAIDGTDADACTDDEAPCATLAYVAGQCSTGDIISVTPSETAWSNLYVNSEATYGGKALTIRKKPGTTGTVTWTSGETGYALYASVDVTTEATVTLEDITLLGVVTNGGATCYNAGNVNWALTDCIIDSTAARGGTIYLISTTTYGADKARTLTFSGCTLLGPSATAASWAFLLKDLNVVTISNCTVDTDNVASSRLIVTDEEIGRLIIRDSTMSTTGNGIETAVDASNLADIDYLEIDNSTITSTAALALAIENNVDDLWIHDSTFRGFTSVAYVGRDMMTTWAADQAYDTTTPSRVTHPDHYGYADEANSIRPQRFTIYRCVQNHTSAAADEPGVGANWETYWVKEEFGRCRVYGNTFTRTGGTARAHTLFVNAPGGIFEGNTITGTAETDYAVVIKSSEVQFRNNKVSGAGTGVYAAGSAGSVFEHNTILGGTHNPPSQNSPMPAFVLGSHQAGGTAYDCVLRNNIIDAGLGSYGIFIGVVDATDGTHTAADQHRRLMTDYNVVDGGTQAAVYYMTAAKDTTALVQAQWPTLAGTDGTAYAENDAHSVIGIDPLLLPDLSVAGNSPAIGAGFPSYATMGAWIPNPRQAYGTSGATGGHGPE